MGSLEFKKDWEIARDRWSAWWHGKETDGPLLGIEVGRKPVQPVDRSAFSSAECEQWWLDGDQVLERSERQIADAVFLDAAFPHVTASLGPGSMAVFLGAKPVFTPTTVWFEPCYQDLRDAEIGFDRGSRWWQWTLDLIEKGLARSHAQRRYLLAMPNLIENLDTLAALLGTEQLLHGLLDCPEEVHRLQGQLLPAWFDAFEDLHRLVEGPDGGQAFTDFMVWAPGRMAKLECDFSAMISPGMFAEFALPYLRDQCDRLDYSLYHLDGPNAICHLDHVLSIDSLNCLQWTPGAGSPTEGDPCWDAIYRKALDAGKLVHASMRPREVGPFVRRFGSRGIYIRTSTATEPEALELLKEVRSW